jgi:hypothetical protein
MRLLCVLCALLAFACGTSENAAFMAVTDPDVYEAEDESDVLAEDIQIAEEDGHDFDLAFEVRYRVDPDVTVTEVEGEDLLIEDVFTFEVADPDALADIVTDTEEDVWDEPDEVEEPNSPTLNLSVYRVEGDVCMDQYNGIPNIKVQWYLLFPEYVEWFKEFKSTSLFGNCLGTCNAYTKYAISSEQINCTYADGCEYQEPKYHNEDTCEVYYGEDNFDVQSLPPDYAYGMEGSLDNLLPGTYQFLLTSGGGSWQSSACTKEDCGFELNEWGVCPEDWWTEETGEDVYHMDIIAEVNGVEYKVTWHPDPRKPRMLMAFEIEMPAGTVTVLNQEHKKVTINNDGQKWSEWHPI